MRIVRLIALIGLVVVFAVPALAILINENGTTNQGIPVSAPTAILSANTARLHWAVTCTGNVYVMPGGVGGVAPSPEPSAVPTPQGTGFLFQANSLFTEQSLPQGTAGASQRIDAASQTGTVYCYTWTE